jgi:alpha-amylase
MCAKFFSDGAIDKGFTPYYPPYEAGINYMNVLSDFVMFVEKPVEKTLKKSIPVSKKSLTLQKN